MVPAQEKTRLRDALREAVRALCKATVSSREEISLQGLIGVTVDHQDVFLVDIAEDIKSKPSLDLSKRSQMPAVGPSVIHHTIDPKSDTVTVQFYTGNYPVGDSDHNYASETFSEQNELMPENTIVAGSSWISTAHSGEQELGLLQNTFMMEEVVLEESNVETCLTDLESAHNYDGMTVDSTVLTSTQVEMDEFVVAADSGNKEYKKNRKTSTDHKEKQGVKTSHLCQVCGEACSSLEARDVHLQVMHPDTKVEYNCEQCDKSFMNHVSLQRHIRRVHKFGNIDLLTKPYCCTLCPRKFAARGSMVRHMQCNHSLDKHVCEICGTQFAHKQTLIRHVKFKHEGKRNHCDICHKVYLRADGVKAHKDRVHNNVRFACTMCDKFFSSRNSLKEHYSFHTGVFRFKCDYCPMQYNGKSAFVEHIAKHFGSKDKCSVCQKEFITKVGLRRHTLYCGKGPQKFSCEYCQAKYSRLETLKQHKRIAHTKPKELVIIKPQPVFGVGKEVSLTASKLECTVGQQPAES